MSTLTTTKIFPPKVIKKSHTRPKYTSIKKNGPLSKKELRERKRERKSYKNNGKLRIDLNYTSTSPNKLSRQSRYAQHTFVSKLMPKMKGHLLQLVKVLDSTRHIQTAIKYGSKAQVLQITQELKGHFIELCTDHYAHITVQRLLEYGKYEVRKIIISEIMRAITRLSTHRLASTIVDYAIMVAADEKTRRRALQYLISRKFILKPVMEQNNEQMPKSIESILSDSDEKSILMSNMYKFLVSGFEKDLMSTGIFEIILYNYFHFADNRQLSEMIELILPSLMVIQNVKEGVFAICDAISYSYFQPKLRKQIVRNIAPFVINMCCDLNSHLIIIRCLDVIDDTVLLKKYILDEICLHFSILMYHDIGRRVILHLLAPRDMKYAYFQSKVFKKICSVPVTELEYKMMDVDGKEMKEEQTLEEEIFGKKMLMDEKIPLKKEKKTELKEFLMVDENVSDSKMVENVDIPNVYRPTCKKPSNIRQKELLQHFIPHLVNFCISQMKEILINELSGAMLLELLQVLIVDEMHIKFKPQTSSVIRSLLEMAKEMKENQNNNQSINHLFIELLFDKILNVLIFDQTPINKLVVCEIPLAPVPEIDANVEISNNIIESSMKMIENKNTNVMNMDTENMSLIAQQNIAKLKEFEMNKKKESKYLKLYAKYETKMIEYQLYKKRNSLKNKKVLEYDLQTSIMNHSLGHRRIRRIVERYSMFHSYLLNAILICDGVQLKSMLNMKGVYIFYELFQCSNEDIRLQLELKLKPVLLDIKNEAERDGIEIKAGLKKFIDVLI